MIIIRQDSEALGLQDIVQLVLVLCLVFKAYIVNNVENICRINL